jgi:tetratricopeptide (TPR) repeat protein
MSERIDQRSMTFTAIIFMDMLHGIFPSARVDYIVQLMTEMVKINEMRTCRCFRAPSLRPGWALVALILAIFAQAAWAADTNTTEGFIEASFQHWHREYQTNSHSAEVDWKLGRACFDMSSLQKDSSAEARYAEDGIAACRAALEQEPSSAPAHYYLGMDIGQLADTKRNLSGLRMVKDMEREFSAARALDQHFDFAGPSRNLGLLYRDAPAIVSIGSRSKARQYLEEAVQLAPEFPENQLNLIESYLKWDYHNEALRQYGELEKMWPAAKEKFIGVPWLMSWTDWNKRLDAIAKKIGKNPKNESPHSQ